MRLCEAYRISHSHFLGGPPEWTQTDRDKAVWYQLRKAETCQSCGTHPDEWDPSKGGDRHAYAYAVQRCPGCAVLEQGNAAQEKDPDKGRGERGILKHAPRAVVIGG